MLDVHLNYAHLHGLLQEQATMRTQGLNDAVEELHRHLSLPQGWNVFDPYEVEDSICKDEHNIVFKIKILFCFLFITTCKCKI